MLQPGDAMPHVQLETVGGALFSYETIWQRRNLVLVTLTSCDDRYASALQERRAEFRELEAECVITCDALPGLPAPGVLIADRWGEIALAQAAAESAGLPSADDLIATVVHLQQRCPECEGEAK
jgi:hypothetical protein